MSTQIFIGTSGWHYNDWVGTFYPANIVYIRMHGPTKLFASSYSDEQLQELATYITSISSAVERAYVYFNNDFHGYAIKNARTLQKLIS